MRERDHLRILCQESGIKDASRKTNAEMRELLGQPKEDHHKQPEGWRAGVDIRGDEGFISSGPVEEPVKDWGEVLRLWNLDPAVFEIVEPVEYKAWDAASKRMYSYRARIQRITKDNTIDISGWRKALKRSSSVARPVSSSNSASTYVILVADPQLGKKNTTKAIENWKKGVLGHQARMSDNYERVILAFMGDEHEGVSGQYASQPHTVELNLSQQLELDFDMRAWTIRQLLESGLTDVVSVISNHGEFTRNGGKNAITGRSDNSSTMIGRMVKQLYADYDLNWHIADGNPIEQVESSGVKMSFSHGHVAKGAGTGNMRVKSALEKQFLGDPSGLGSAQIHFTAHYHHFFMVEDRGRTFVGCPALEAEDSSDYMRDQYGVWSRPGMLGLTVSDKFGERAWASPLIF